MCTITDIATIIRVSDLCTHDSTFIEGDSAHDERILGCKCILFGNVDMVHDE